MCGLSKKIHIIKKEQNKNTACLSVDAGNLLFAHSKLPGNPESDERKARALTQAYIALTDTVLNIGANDLAAGIPFIKELAATYPGNLISANLKSVDANASLLPQVVKRKVGDLDIAIIGLSYLGKPFNDGSVAAMPWSEVLPGLLQQCNSADMVILLSNYPEKENEAIANRFESVHIIIQAGMPSLREPFLVNNTLMCMTPARGKYQGMLTINWDDTHRWMVNKQ